jgi:hypothetical protein
MTPFITPLKGPIRLAQTPGLHSLNETCLLGFLAQEPVALQNALTGDCYLEQDSPVGVNS